MQAEIPNADESNGEFLARYEDDDNLVDGVLARYKAEDSLGKRAMRADELRRLERAAIILNRASFNAVVVGIRVTITAHEWEMRGFSGPYIDVGFSEIDA
jgi:hypothetical protein